MKMNTAPKIPKSLAEKLNLMAAALLPTLPATPALPAYTPAPDVAALLKRLTESEDDADIAQTAAAWRASAAAPLRHQAAVQRTAGWRKKRGLDAKEIVFGASASGNFLLVGKVGAVAAPMSRAEFYTLTLPAFEDAVTKINPGTDPAKWKAVATAFMNDAVKDGAGQDVWPLAPAISGLKASLFAQQLLRDCLTDAMGMLDGPPAAPPPPLPPLLAALGEHRRSGNHYTRDDAELRRNELIKELQKPSA